MRCHVVLLARHAFSVGLVLMLAAIPIAPAWAGPKEDALAKIRALQTERRDVLQRRMQIYEELAKDANALGRNQVVLVTAAQELGQANLDLCQTRGERLAARRELLAALQRVERHAKVMVESGIWVRQDVLLAQAKRVQAELELLKLEIDGRPVSSQEASNRAELKKELLSALNKRLLIWQELCRQGTDDENLQLVDGALAAHRDLTIAELESIDSLDQRIAAQMARSKELREFEERVLRQIESGRGNPLDSFRATIARLLAEINLLQEQAKSAKPPPEANEKLKALRAECVTLVTKFRLFNNTLTESGSLLPHINPLATQLTCWQAEFACCATREERLEKLSSSLAEAKKEETKAGVLVGAGKRTRQEQLAAQAGRLAIEIALERERLAKLEADGAKLKD